MIFLSTPRGNTCSAHQLNVYSSFWEEDESEQGELGTQPSIKGPFDLSAREADFTPRPTATSFPSEVSCDIPSSVELNWHRGESPHAMPPGGPCCGVGAGTFCKRQDMLSTPVQVGGPSGLTLQVPAMRQAHHVSILAVTASPGERHARHRPQPCPRQPPLSPFILLQDQVTWLKGKNCLSEVKGIR